MLITSITPEIIKPFFQNAYYYRGMTYYEEDRVHDLEFATQKDSEIIRACVEGASQDHYQVKITLSNTSNHLYIRGDCTCPMSINCKHVVATLLTAIAQAESLAEERRDEQREQQLISKNDPFTQPMTKRNSQADIWLNKLKAMIKEDKKLDKEAVDESYSLHYIFSSPENDLHKNALYLDFQLVRHLKSGRLGASKKIQSRIKYS